MVLASDTSFKEFKVRGPGRATLAGWRVGWCLHCTGWAAVGPAALSARAACCRPPVASFTSAPCWLPAPALIITAPHPPQAVKDVFLPDSGLWVSEYPHADRAQFIDVSLAIEREAAEAAAGGPAAQPAQQQQYGSGYDSGYYGSPPPPSQQQQQPPPQYWDGDGGGNGGFDAYDVPPPRY